MSYSPIAIKRNRILGDLNKRCEPVESIPIYLEREGGELLGHVDESLGRYADAFVFHVPEDYCKKLSTNSFECGLNYDYVKGDKSPERQRRIKLNFITLTPRVEPLSRMAKKSAADAAAAALTVEVTPDAVEAVETVAKPKAKSPGRPRKS